MNRTQHIAYFKVPYKQKDQNNDNFCCGNKKSSKGDGITDNEYPELNQFYYHSDHLGSSSYITNLSGNIVQHIEYVPFGEVFLEERNNKWNTPYLFNGKELDEETGFYYYGARYYDSRNSIFLSVDPLWEAKPSFSPYNYCSWNPVMRVDPDGRLDGDHLDVTKNNDGTYNVEGGEANSDKNIYVVDKEGNRTGEIVGEMMTEYSFHHDDGSAVVGANIDLNDQSGEIFFDDKIKDIGLFEYMSNAKGGEPLDFKTNDIPNDLKKEKRIQYIYRGMSFDGKIASARDIGNYSAGYVAGKNGFSWGASRFAFDALQTKQNKGFMNTYLFYPLNRVREGQPTQRAQRIGYNLGSLISK